MNENFDNMKEIYTIEEIYMIKEMEHYNYFRIPIGAMYRFNNSKISPYLKSGVSLYLYDNFLLNQEIFINAKVGVRIIQKIDVSVEKDFSPSLNIQPINFMHFNVGYIF
jgi:hypothetical protein